jgi:hypothetical protein
MSRTMSLGKFVLAAAFLAGFGGLQEAHAGLMGYWDFDNAASVLADSSPTHRNATASGTLVQDSSVPTQIGAGSSLRFNAADGADYFQSAWSPASPMKAFTVSWWLNPIDYAHLQVISATGGWSQYQFHGWNTNGSIHTGVDTTYRFTPSELGPGTITNGTWQHFTYVYDGATQYFYKNGSLVASKPSLNAPLNWTGLDVGSSDAGGTIHGLVDDVAVWNEPLTAGQVAALASGSRSPSSWTTHYSQTVMGDRPIGYWRLNETTGNKVYDQTVNNHIGTISGAVALGSPGATKLDGDSAANFGGGAITFADVTGLSRNFSVEFWINPDSHTGYTQGLGAANWDQFSFHTAADGSIFCGITTGSRFILPANTLEIGKWQHVVFTFEENYPGATLGQAIFYKNGQALASKQMPIAQAWTSFALTGSLDGLMDEVAIYDYALSAASVGEHFRAAVPEPSAFVLAACGGLALAGLSRRTRRNRGR